MNAPTPGAALSALHAAFMDEAICEAHAAAAHADVPVGAVVVVAGKVVGRGHNRREVDGDPTAHAEVLAIREAACALGTWYLVGATLYVTQEPCPMCAGALVNARIAALVYGCDNPKAGAVRSLFQIPTDPRLNHRVEVTAGVAAERCGRLLSDFFKELRARRADAASPAAEPATALRGGVGSKPPTE